MCFEHWTLEMLVLSTEEMCLRLELFVGKIASVIAAVIESYALYTTVWRPCRTRLCCQVMSTRLQIQKVH